MAIQLPDFATNGARDWKGIVIHHSATVDGKTSDWEGIKKYHTSWRFNDDIITAEKAKELEVQGKKGVLKPWSDIGYHIGIEDDGGKIVVKEGRKLAYIGGHAKEFNSTHIGLCVIGNFDVEVPPLDKWTATIDIVAYFRKLFSLTIDSIVGHRETFTLRGVPVEKTCPGKLWNMIKFRSEIV